MTEQNQSKPEKIQYFSWCMIFIGLIFCMGVLIVYQQVNLDIARDELATRPTFQSCFNVCPTVGQEYTVGQKEIGVQHLLNLRTDAGFAEHLFMIRDPPTQAPYVECEFTDRLTLNKRITLDYVFGFNKTILRVEDLTCMEAHPNRKANESCADVITTQGPAINKISKTFDDEPKQEPVTIAPSKVNFTDVVEQIEEGEMQ